MNTDMNPDELIELLGKANRALAAGEDTTAVNDAIRNRTGGALSDIASLERAASSLPQQEERPSFMGAGNLTRMAAQGATFGFADELAGLGAAMVPGGRGYEEARDISRARVGRLRRDYPVQSMAAEMAGGSIVPGIGGARLAGSALRATGSRLASSVAGAAGAGALGGGLTGAGESEAGDRLAGAFTGAAFGAGVGAGLGGAANVAGRIVRPIVGAVAERFPNIGSGVSGALARSEERFAREAAAGQIERAAQRAGKTPQQLLEKLERLPPGSVPADIGPEMSGIARAALNEIPALRSATGPMQAIRERMRQRGTRIVQYLRDAAKPEASFDQSRRAANELVQQVRDEYYAPLEELVDDARNLPNVMAVLEAGDSFLGRANVNVPDLKKPVTFRDIQDIRADLRDEVSAAREARRPGRAQRAQEVLDFFESVLEEDIPGMAEANRAYYIAQSRVRAHELGLKAINKSSLDIFDQIEELPEEARDAFRLGLLEAFSRRLTTRKGGGATASAMIDAGDEMIQKLRALSQSDQDFEKFIRQGLDTETIWGITARELTGNSTTARQQIEAANLRQVIPSSAKEAASRIANLVLGETPSETYAMRRMLGEQLLGPVQPFREGLLDRVLSPSYRFAPGFYGAIGSQVGSQGLRRPALPVELELEY